MRGGGAERKNRKLLGSLPLGQREIVAAAQYPLESPPSSGAAAIPGDRRSSATKFYGDRWRRSTPGDRGLDRVPFPPSRSRASYREKTGARFPIILAQEGAVVLSPGPSRPDSGPRAQCVSSNRRRSASGRALVHAVPPTRQPERNENARFDDKSIAEVAEGDG